MAFSFYHEHKTKDGLPFYDGWAFCSDSSEKYKANMTALKEYEGRYVSPKSDESIAECAEHNPDKLVYKIDKIGYGRNSYFVKSNPEKLSLAEIALIVDRGNLCFGYCGSTYGVDIYTD